MEKQLPKDWKCVKLGEIVSLLGDGLHGTPEYSENGDYYFINGNNLSDGKILLKENTKRVSLKEYEKYKKQLNDKTILVSINGTIGNVAFYKNEKVILGKSACYFNVIDTVDKNYVRLMLTGQRFLNYAHNTSTGSTIKNVSLKSMREFEIPLPEKPTQQAIVSKIEELFSELDKGIENLRLAQQQLKTYRQSVLKWAFEGKLTNENVKEGELPKGWNLTKLGEYINDISSGKSYRCDERPPKQNEVGIVKVSSVTWGFFNEMESKTCFSKDFLNEKYLIKKGDFLFSRANTIELIGACVLVNKIGKTLMLSDKILRFTFSKDVSKEYVLYYLRSRKGRKQIESLSTGNQDSMRNIGQEKIRQIEFPYCPIKEQNSIVQEIESRLSVADKMEESITQSLQQAEALRQSILKKAFEGKLIK